MLVLLCAGGALPRCLQLPLAPPSHRPVAPATPPPPVAGSQPFDAAAFAGYTPVRGYDEDPFPHSRAITYRFAFLPHDDCLRPAEGGAPLRA